MAQLNIKSSTIDKSLETATGFLKKLVGPSVEEMGLLFADNVKKWRFNNQVKNLKKIKEKLEKDNIPARVINPKVLFPYLEAISLEEDNDLHELWANLITNYIDPAKNLETIVYPEILRQLSSKEVKIIDDFYSGELIEWDGLPTPATYSEPKYTAFECANLVRLGLVKTMVNVDFAFVKNIETHSSVRVTHFGHAFYQACHRNPITNGVTSNDKTQ
ncbi:MAG: hypothetical protein JWO09_866 [Bacteroidetes bacterium]|nr:hypothetical protein [Bacteroidota bacterium]